MTQWYAFGEVGEYVLDYVEAMIDQAITLDTFVAGLREVNMSDQEINDVYTQEVLGL